MSGHRLPVDGILACTERWCDQKDPGDGGTIKAKKSPAYIDLRTGGAETRSLLAPDGPCQTLVLGFGDDGGDCVVTSTPDGVNQTGNTVMTFADVGDVIELRSIVSGSSFVWRVVHNDGVALS